jgi:hypothetical protein
LALIFGFDSAAQLRDTFQQMIDWEEFQHLWSNLLCSEAAQGFIKAHKKNDKFISGQSLSPSDSSLDPPIKLMSTAAAIPMIPYHVYHANIRDLDDIFGGTIINRNSHLFKRPNILDGIEGAYIMEVTDNCMSPKYSMGDVVLVDPCLPPIQGDDVVVQLHYKSRVVAIVRELVHFEEIEAKDSEENLTKIGFWASRDFADALFDFGWIAGATFQETQEEEDYNNHELLQQFFKDSTVGMTLGADGSFIKFERKPEERGSDKKLVGDEVKLRIKENLKDQYDRRLEQTDTVLQKVTIHVVVGCNRNQRSITRRREDFNAK